MAGYQAVVAFSLNQNPDRLNRGCRYDRGLTSALQGDLQVMAKMRG